MTSKPSAPTSFQNRQPAGWRIADHSVAQSHCPICSRGPQSILAHSEVRLGSNLMPPPPYCNGGAFAGRLLQAHAVSKSSSKGQPSAYLYFKRFVIRQAFPRFSLVCSDKVCSSEQVAVGAISRGTRCETKGNMRSRWSKNQRQADVDARRRAGSKPRCGRVGQRTIPASTIPDCASQLQRCLHHEFTTINALGMIWRVWLLFKYWQC